MSGSAVPINNGSNLKQKYVYLNGKSFVSPEDIFYIQYPANKKEVLCFTFDDNRRLIPLVSYGHFSACAGRMAVRMMNSNQDRRTIYNPFINKHQQLLFTVGGFSNGIKDGVIEDPDKFYSALSALIAAQDLTKQRYSWKYTFTIDQNQFTRLYKYGHNKVLLGNMPITRQTTSQRLLHFIAEYDSWLGEGLPYRESTIMADATDFIKQKQDEEILFKELDRMLGMVEEEQSEEEQNEILFKELDKAFGFVDEGPSDEEQSDEILFKELDKIMGAIDDEESTAKKVTKNSASTLITPMFNNKKRQNEVEIEDLSQDQQPSVKIARTRTPTPFPF